MSKSNTYTSNDGPTSPQLTYDPHPPTTAAFSPTPSSGYSAALKQRSTVIVHKKSPLLVATPPQITRALAHSHPYLLPLNKLVGLISWSTDDPWESYLLVAAYWAATLYAGHVIRYTGPLILVTFLILGMYSRRYSPLSSTSTTGEKHSKSGESATVAQHKSLDEIVETLAQFTSRCNILLDPFVAMTDFLSTQRTPTSATTRPALTTLFIRILLVSPLWLILTLPPFYIITARRVILFTGTTILTWHSRPARVTRVLLWRSLFLRRLAALITGLSFPDQGASSTNKSATSSQQHSASAVASTRRAASSGVRFTFILYENQRRWIGLGWTTSLFSYERGPWTDEHLNPASSKDEFELPEVDGEISKWRWVDKSDWRIERGDAKQHARHASTGSRTGPTGSSHSSSGSSESHSDGGGWIYYDNKWEEGRFEDGWGRYTRRRKWYRDAELVEATSSTATTPKNDGAQSDNDDSEAARVKRARDYASKLNSAAPLNTSMLPSSPTTPTANNPTSVPTSTATTTATPSSTTPSTATKRRTGWFGTSNKDPPQPVSKTPTNPASDTRRRTISDARSTTSSSKRTGLTGGSNRSREGPEDDQIDRWRDQNDQRRGFSVVGGDDLSMNLS